MAVAAKRKATDLEIGVDDSQGLVVESHVDTYVNHAATSITSTSSYLFMTMNIPGSCLTR